MIISKGQELKNVESVYYVVKKIILKIESDFGIAYLQARKLCNIVEEMKKGNLLNNIFAESISNKIKNLPYFEEVKAEEFIKIFWDIEIACKVQIINLIF